jgi:hypothetical protein
VEGSSSATLAQGQGRQREECGDHGGAGKLGVVLRSLGFGSGG